MSAQGGRGSGAAQAACLLRDTISALVSSAVSSLRLLLVSNRCRDSGCGVFELYQGRVWHERRRPVLHRFEYNVRYALIDLDRPPDWFRARASTHHLTAVESRSIARTSGAVRLLTIPTSVGYEQNPLSVYYCYNTEEVLERCIAEVTNTPWAERVTFVFEPGLDVVPKPLHVSPFMDMHGVWRMKVTPPGEELQLVIQVQHPELGNYFSAVLKAKRVESRKPETFFWLMPHKVALWIYWHAVLLVFKGVPFITHPKYIDGDAYRELAKRRDEELRATSPRGSALTPEHSAARFCSWRDAPCWPWR